MKKIITLAIVVIFALNSFAQKTDSTKTSSLRIRGASPTTYNDPLIVIDGDKQYPKGTWSLKELDQNNIESISVWKDSTALSKYGTEAYAGVVEITTKNNPTKPFKNYNLPKNLSDSNYKGKISGLKFHPKMPLNTEPSKLRYLLFKNSDPRAKRLYILDGKEITDASSLSPDSIESVNVLKDASATTQYGEKGKNGVIIITSKKAKKN